jgi:hypothetical protein
MNDLKVRRLTGAFGLAGFVVFLAATPLYFIGPSQPARTEDAAQLGDFLTSTGTQILTRTTIADPIIIACFVVFLAGFRHLIRQARQDYEWVGTLVFGAGLIFVTLQLAADALQAGAALDASVKADPSVVRGLFEASYVLYGAIGLIMVALLMASAGYAILATGVLPRWAGWAAYASAVLNLAAAPSIFGGTDYTAFYSASGWVTYIGQLTFMIWFLIASVLMLRKREALAAQKIDAGPDLRQAGKTNDKLTSQDANPLS